MGRRSNFPRIAKDLYSTPAMELMMSKVRAGGSQNAEVAPTRLAAAQIEEAARWLAATTEPPRPLIPYLRKTFRLSAAEAIQVIRLANAARGLP